MNHQQKQRKKPHHRRHLNTTIGTSNVCSVAGLHAWCYWTMPHRLKADIEESVSQARIGFLEYVEAIACQGVLISVSSDYSCIECYSIYTCYGTQCYE